VIQSITETVDIKKCGKNPLIPLVNFADHSANLVVKISCNRITNELLLHFRAF
jgi:hypothetical protein